MRGQLVGVVVAGAAVPRGAGDPRGVSTLHAASDFVANEVPQLMAKGVGLRRANRGQGEIASDAKARTKTRSLRSLAAGFGLGAPARLPGGDGLTPASTRWGDAAGCSRFWGSLGIALGVAVSFIFFQFPALVRVPGAADGRRRPQAADPRPGSQEKQSPGRPQETKPPPTSSRKLRVLSKLTASLNPQPRIKRNLIEKGPVSVGVERLVLFCQPARASSSRAPPNGSRMGPQKVKRNPY